MKRDAFLMKINPGAEDEYKKRHDEIWPELVTVLKDAGISRFLIWRDGLTLFSYVEYEDDEKRNSLYENPVQQKWWDYMADIMEVNSDNSPVVQKIIPVFCFE